MPDSDYVCVKPAIHAPGQPLDDTPNHARKVSAAFSRIYSTGDFLAAWDGGLISGNRYTSRTANSGMNNHFQGVTRLKDSDYLVISGGDKKRRRGHLFIVHMESRTFGTAWRTNVHCQDMPPAGDRIAAVICVNDDTRGLPKDLWHVGGIDSCGDILAAPVESSDQNVYRSRILFYNLHDPRQPTLLPNSIWIDRPDAKAGAVAITKLASSYTLLAVLGKYASDGRKYLDLYFSRTTDWSDGFDAVYSLHVPGAEFNCQSMSLINEDNQRLYLMTMRNTQQSAPVIGGEDWAHLFELRIDPSDLLQVRPGNCTLSGIYKLSEKHFTCKIRGRKRRYSPFQCNFNAGAGIYIHTGGAMFLYSCFHWLRNHRIRLAEFRPPPERFSPTRITSVDDMWIDMFEHNHFRGLRFGIQGADDATISDFLKLAVQSRPFDKAVSSVRYQIPLGKSLRLYRHKDFRSKNNDYLDLVGDGKLQTRADLKKDGFGDKTLSCQLVDNLQRWAADTPGLPP